MIEQGELTFILNFQFISLFHFIDSKFHKTTEQSYVVWIMATKSLPVTSSDVESKKIILHSTKRPKASVGIGMNFHFFLVRPRQRLGTICEDNIAKASKGYKA